MIRTLAFALTITAAGWFHPAQAQLKGEGLVALGEVTAAFEKVIGFQAEVQISEGPAAAPTTVSLTISKDLGWKVKSFSPGNAYEFICDYKTFWQFLPTEKKVMVSKADRPEAVDLFRKPVDDINPLGLLDPTTLKYKGQEKVNGETTHYFQGTTSTQLLMEGAAVKTEMEAWVSPVDGLPRKTIERTAQGTGTTIMKNIVINPSLTPADFTYTPPPGVELVDMSQGASQGQPEGGLQSGPAPRNVLPPTSN